MMFLCFFSLSASMSANLYEQTKEIGILRSIGFTKIRIRLLYFYEALVLVFTSSMLGVLVGVGVGMTLALQQSIYNMTSVNFYFPWKQTFLILMLSVLCAFASTWGPTTQLTNKKISALFRAA